MNLNRFQHKINRIWTKNGADIQAILTGTMPPFIYLANNNSIVKEVPVFVFHTVRPRQFEEQLSYLADNGYQTLIADELLAAMLGQRPIEGRTVALTFDDATGSFWAIAFPLLKKYRFKAILFVSPGLVPSETTRYPNLEDVWHNRADLAEVVHREEIQPLCTWVELLAMQESGLVDVQSHSLTHTRINISPKIVDFVHPQFDPHFYANINIPVSLDDLTEPPLRPFLLGQPIYLSASRLAARPRYLESNIVSKKLVEYVAQQGGPDFFADNRWRGKLRREYKQLIRKQPLKVEYESPAETEAAIRREMSMSRQWLEAQLGKPIHHFCYPWFQGSSISDQIAAECGYKAVFYGLGAKQNNIPSAETPVRIRRISDEYLYCLPGNKRHSVVKILGSKIWRYFARAPIRKSQKV